MFEIELIWLPTLALQFGFGVIVIYSLNFSDEDRIFSVWFVIIITIVSASWLDFGDYFAK